ncbi:inositol hexakisphosphate and diphosphoinositol-pentakisphosphate kinase 1 isoform X14 [Canis lupus baileyi]|uniref:Inositol hexakisphosphate and diphosphoinositol-pentakisphosphate kinase n=2 Tax=Canis lupus familiaris TaxID=9615 RepID=A0A8P0SHQ9_CANLF|nr:inositol hexakisphosphate and diphosphoinositol-pentakisphosphate kinase 1 isoform X11 [Canis lupus familiaris]XP_038317020.1 inositol hexakisphosphate and diphosphoinositol-pentakisphosphate kinase 1 isoform X11 [Canis lupus familiaris]XP_038436162.1 inositol hexakisphosphate and diphosphoinositol-pentakisphosphate kinase 1 isoform X11 [Canis lupus familiaris]XP_048960225.1 inositol hexakisphosphate and diphosphoinositol-pentakisphosphate kinase 1 isoform X14 [Canis lupus dingo]|eukprot:XP_005638407.1 inositol hexakisphosphate and diphosphoinositol-pentakisphosphate kinase 1 isoform X11 [Canis lupus familiaris]
MWSLPASEGESATAHFFLGAGDEGLGTRGIGMRTEESDNELLEDEEDEVPPEPQIIVGICAMTKKSKSKPMTQILERLCRFDYLTVIILGEDVILNEPVENWPSCHCLISFHSKGFPLDKAVAYSKLRNPFLINDLAMQYYIQDRREVYRILQEEGIDLPRYAVLNRDPARPEECNLIEGEDQVEVNGAVFPKPFVEKPVSAEDHNVYIYYPSSAGGGSQRLFRKIGSRSSVYSPESSVRKTGSYIYEEFMPTDGTDVKVYTVGPDYAHAEARKSPALDGKVERDSEGKEIRYPVMLTAMEKLVARKVCVAFKQTVCGFDLLRANGHSFVCDVNGFSFVKNSMKYYDDCAKILGNTIMRELAPQFQIPWSIPTEAEDIPIVPTTSGTMMELRCVIAIIRHGDRTPKQKMKMEVTHPRFFSLFEKHGGYKTGKLKLKRPEQLQEVLDITRLLLAELEKEPGGEIEEKTGKLEQLKSVLEMYGHFSGINRKVQLTYYPHGVKATNEGQDPQREALAPSLLLVLKWGGELTPAGRVQAEELGRAFRCMYPGGQGDYAGFPGCGLLRLHSTFRHDLKIYASDEGRVQMTAAAFAKGLLALEGELTPILVQMVKSANMNGLLDSDGDSLSSCQHRVKARLHHILQQDAPFGPEDYDQLAPTGSTSLLNSMAVIQNPVKVCDQVFALIENLTHQIRERMQDPKSVDLQLYHSETLELMLQRWSKLERDFRQKSGRYDISKIPDIYDCVKYDVQHNGSLGLQGTAELLRLSKALADVVIPQEYGISREEKLEIAVGFCLPLLRKILLDLQRTHEDESVNKLHPLYSRGVLSPGRHVRTRLYFTSESHVHSLLSVFRYGGLLDETQDAQWQRALAYLSAISELNYMTQIVIMLYEDNTRDPLSEERFHVELHFSPGVKGVEEEGSAPTGCGFRPASSENEEMKTDQGSMENLCPGKASDEPDRALQTSPQPLEGPGLPRRSPLIRNRKAGSMEVLSETSSSRPGSYRLFSSARPPTEMKQSGLGFEGCSMVPTIYPLETLHNALSLRQVSEFLSRVCQRHTDAQAQASAALFDSMHSNQASDSPFSPPRTLHSPTLQLRQRSEKPPWYSSGPSSTVSSAGPSSPTAVDGNCPFGFSDQPSVSSHMIEEHQGLGMLPRNGEQELPIEGVQEPFEPSQSSQEPPVETSQPCQEVVEEISQPCQEVPDISQPCQDIPEEVSQPCQEVPDIGQPCQENHDSVNQICQEVPQIHQPCQKASQLCQKMSEDACQLCQKNPEKVSQPSLDVPVEVGRLAHGFPVGVRDLVQEIHVEVGRPAQETPEEFSQPCQEFFVEVGRLAQEASAINLLSQDIPEVDKPSQEFPGEDDLQVQEVPEINQQSWVVPEVIDQLPGEDIPQAQYLSSDPNPQSQSLAHDQYSPLPPATCD